ncbi:hypothetical protein CDL12_12525 [Handroanthus impetiginosus]|uniref:Uncharacterized protein n=1 Tax=Handroanthus impetiginosus TaxID=429701 RepID=A0A2G9HBG1_9LAMI|nr:hypothetical protein CDL12_12525 [Handroanthus impetiginosus]
MMIKPDPAAGPINSPVATACGNCQVQERLLLHHVRHRGIIRRLCTTCVLRLHPQSFCPTCFQVYPSPPSNDAVLPCVKCYSPTHTHCVATGPTAPSSPYICPLCVNPRAPIFKLKTAKEAHVKTGEGLSVKNEECKVMDRDAAKKLLAAATIASTSMNKAAVVAKLEAEKRAKEAACTRKRAREALEHVAYLVMKEKLRKKEAAGSGLTGVGGNVGYVAGGFNAPKLKRESNINVGSDRNGVGASMIVEEKINRMGNADGMNNSNQILAAMNAVELKENEKMGGITSHGVTLNDDKANMDVDEKDRMMVNGGGFSAERNNGTDIGHVMYADMETGTENLSVQGERQDDTSIDVVLVPTAPDQNNQMHYKENSNGEEQHPNAGRL